ncbi:MAG: hypothetical protein ACYCR4_14295 [Acidimicrobiales bacterium]
MDIGEILEELVIEEPLEFPEPGVVGVRVAGERVVLELTQGVAGNDVDAILGGIERLEPAHRGNGVGRDSTTDSRSGS